MPRPTQPRLSLRLFSFTLGLAAAGLTLAQPVNLKFAMPLGKTFNYSVDLHVKVVSAAAMANGDFGQSMAAEARALSKTAQGIKVQTTIKSVKVTSSQKGSVIAGQMEQRAKQAEGTSFDATYDSLARPIVEAGKSPLSQMGAMSAGFMGAQFAGHPVSPGGTWSTSIDFAKILGAAGGGMISAGAGSKIPINYKLIRLTSQGGKSLAEIGYTMKGDLNLSVGQGGGGGGMNPKVSLDVTGSVLVDVSNGVPVSGTSKGNTHTAFGGMTITQSMVTTFRLK